MFLVLQIVCGDVVDGRYRVPSRLRRAEQPSFRARDLVTVHLVVVPIVPHDLGTVNFHRLIRALALVRKNALFV